MKEELIKLLLVGTRPLLMHSSRLADPLDPASKRLAKLTVKSFKTEADHKEISRVEWFGGLWLHDDLPCIPPTALEGAFIRAAKMRRRGSQASAGFIVKTPAMLVYDGPTDVEELWKRKQFRHRTSVRVKTGRTMRTRACFKEWSAVCEAAFLPSMFSPSDIVEIYAVAGYAAGLGDWRPKFGTFLVEAME